MDENEILHDPHHLGVPSGASKMISELTDVQRNPCTYLESRLALYPNRPKRASIWASSPRSTIQCVQNDFWGYGWCKPCTYLALKLKLPLNRPNKLPFKPRHPGVSSSASKIISEPTVRMAQTMHPSCTETNSTSKRTERTFYMTHVTYEFHQVHPKWFLWQTVDLSCTETNTIFKWTETRSTWPTSPRSSIGCVQNDFRAYGTFGANPAPILNQD
jgi:hypothetical protein